MWEINVLDYKNASKVLAKVISLVVDWLPSTYKMKRVIDCVNWVPPIHNPEISSVSLSIFRLFPNPVSDFNKISKGGSSVSDQSEEQIIIGKLCGFQVKMVVVQTRRCWYFSVQKGKIIVLHDVWDSLRWKYLCEEQFASISHAIFCLNGKKWSVGLKKIVR